MADNLGHAGARREIGDAEDISVVIVSWNVRELLRNCIRSLHSLQEGLIMRVIVVDNASPDGSAKMVRAEFPDVHVIASDSNLGFARANNLGLRIARGRYVLFLNPDTLARKDALAKMKCFLDTHAEFDAVGPRLILPDGTVQPSCARRLPSISLIFFEALYLHRLPVIGLRLANWLLAPYDLNHGREVEAVAGAAMLVRRRVVNDLQGFDESFMHTGEDMDLCLRLRRRGSRIFYLADSEVVHLHGQSSSQAWVRAGTMSILSMEKYFRRSHGRFHAWIYRLIVQVVQMPMMLAVAITKSILRRNPNEFGETLRFAKAVWRWRVSP